MVNLAEILYDSSITDIRNSESGYNYYLFVRAGGAGVIVRENTAQTEYRYFTFSNANRDADFSNRANLNYVMPYDLPS